MPNRYEMLTNHASAVETNLYRTGVRARLSAMPLLNSSCSTPVVLITSIEVAVEARSRGHGAALLHHATKTADARGVTLTLVVNPDGSPNGLDDAELAAWYGRHGFLRLCPESLGAIEMERKPSTTF